MAISRERKRSTARAALLAIAALAISPHAQASGALALVINSAEASLSVVDMASLREMRRIPVLREPHHVALAPDGGAVLVGDTAGNEVLLLDPLTLEVRRRVPVADPYQLGFSPDGKLLVVNGLARNQVDVYDAATLRLVHRFPLSSMPSHMAFAPDASMAFISLQGTGKLAALDLRRMTVLWEAPVGPAPAGVMFHNDRVLVADMGADYIAVVDPVDGHVERRIRTGRGAHTLFRSPDGKLIYVNDRVDGTTVALDAATLAEIRRYVVPGGPDDIAFAPDGQLWITQRFARTVAVLDPASGAIRTVAVGRSPHGIYLTTDRQVAR